MARGKNKRMRLPNGFGRITKLKGNLRKPYRAMVTIGKDESGRPIGKLLKPISYFSTYNEAYQALMEYNRNPLNLEVNMTLGELYEEWYPKHTEGLSNSAAKNIKTAWVYCHEYYDVSLHSLRPKVIKGLIETANKLDEGGNIIEASEHTKRKILNALHLMLDYAVENEYITHNYSRDVNAKLDNSSSGKHHAFTEEELNIIRKLKDSDPIARIIYVHCYTGMRPDELCTVKRVNIFMDNWYLVGGMKTQAGKDRIIPIHENIRDYVRDYYYEAIESGRDFLIPAPGRTTKLVYSTYRRLFSSFLSEHGLDTTHSPHDCRKTFITMAKKSGVDEYTIKRIVGHSIKDITEAIYTDRDVKWLHSELSKIP